MGLSNFQRGSMGQDVAALGNLGAFRQGLTQSQLAADQAAARTAAFEPQQRLQQYGAGLSGLSGFGGVAPQIPQGGASPLASALSTATGLAGIFVNYTETDNETIKRPMFRSGWSYQRRDHGWYERATSY